MAAAPRPGVTSERRAAVEHLLTVQQLAGQLIRDILMGGHLARPSATANAMDSIRWQLERAQEALAESPSPDLGTLLDSGVGA